VWKPANPAAKSRTTWIELASFGRQSVTWFFAFGLSTSSEQMQADTGVHLRAEKARLADHAYTFAGYDEHYKGGTSRLLALPGAHVLGVAYPIDSAQLEKLEAAGNGYVLHEHHIELSGESVIATTLEAPEERPLSPPGRDYVERVRSGLSRHYNPEIVDRYLQRAVARATGAPQVALQEGTSDRYVRSETFAFRRMFPWDTTKSKVFGSGWVVLQAGDATPPESHDEEESFVFVAGAGEMSLDGMPFSVQKGDTVYIEPFTAHSVRNDGDEALEFICLWWNEVEPSPVEVTSTGNAAARRR
jgi:mannose-6-phosphate isomerase-like protein (cupin superfamily)